MNAETAIRWIGISHLLQPPLAFFLLRRVRLLHALRRCPASIQPMAHNMVVASIALPTALGLVLAWHAAAIETCDAVRSLAWLAAGFWSWRLYRQWGMARAGHHPSPSMRLWHVLLSLIFFIQGPTLGLVLVFSMG